MPSATTISRDVRKIRKLAEEMGDILNEGVKLSIENPQYLYTDLEALKIEMIGRATANAAERDASAYIPFLDAQPNVDTSKKIGTQGYCMGGPLIVRTAAAQADRIGAAASFHGGGLVTANANSPHLLAPNIQARMYFGIASNDDAQQPEAKDVLRETFADAGVAAEIEVYSDAQHGWCVTDMPAGDGAPIYNEVDAERAWGKLMELYEAALA